MFCIGLLGGSEIAHSGIDLTALKIMLTCILLSFLTPFFSYQILKFKTNVYDAGAIAASYGSASASYIAVPATMRFAVPKANMGLLLPMALGITFTFNVVIGIPFYNYIIHLLWAK